MKYCTNCGKETKAKICPHCGNKSRKAKNYCGWCGTEIDRNAVICPNCHEKLKEGFGAKFAKFLGVIAALFFLVLAALYVEDAKDGSIPSVVLLTIGSVLMLPFVKNIIRNMTFGNKLKRNIFSVVRVIVIAVVLVNGCALLPEEEAKQNEVNDPIQHKVYKDEATDAALKVFHSEVKLRNEQSFVLNDSNVTYVTPYKENDNLALVTVVLDYSAQNGFGGMERETYVVKLIFTYSNGKYRQAD